MASHILLHSMAKNSADPVMDVVVISLLVETFFFGVVIFSNLLVNLAEMGDARGVLSSLHFNHYPVVGSHSGAPF